MNMLMKATGALTLGAATLTATVAPAEARRYYRDRDRTGTAVVAGIAGLAIGAALASSSRRGGRYYNDGYYYNDYPRYRHRGYGYYDDYHYRPRYRSYYRDCYTRRVYDPYLDRRVRVRYCR